MYKVFFNDRIVFLNSEVDELQVKRGNSYSISSTEMLKNCWSEFFQNESIRAIEMHPEEGFNLIEQFFKLFKNIHAAGGMVENQQGYLLCIYRWGKWDLPKGKVEQGESYEMAALREVEEECGITGLVLENLVLTTYHIYISNFDNKRLVLKHTHWYKIAYHGNEILQPQLEEDIEKAEWFPKNRIQQILENTYASLYDMVNSWATLL